MDENHQDKTEGTTPANTGKLPLPPLSSQDQRGPAQPQNNQMEDIIKHLRGRGYKVTEEYNDTGLSNVSGEHPQRKTLWDWGQLLIIPLLIVLLGIGFSWFQNQTSFQIAKDNRTQDLQIAKDNRTQDLQIANDTQEEATLKAYLDDMTALLLDKKLGSQAIADKAISAEAAIIARAKTLTALSRLTNPQRKARLLQFLYEAHLIGALDINTDNRYGQIINLSNADLRNADLRNASLSGANLTGADLRGADLRNADLRDATLSCLETAPVCIDLRNANLRDANLFGAYLGFAVLAGADLRNAKLNNAILLGAILSDADLLGAMVTQEQLAKAKSLKGATMPDGSKHP